MALEWIDIYDFRNIVRADIRFSPGLNLIIGINGQGKSNLLEAIGLLATGRSFRRATSSTMRRWEQPRYRVKGKVLTNGMKRELDLLGEANRQIVRLDGKPMTSISLMERVLTAVIITPETPILVRGGPTERRSFLDWLIFLTTQRHGVESREYHRAMKARNQLLRYPGNARELDAWEAQLANLGAKITLRRFQMVEQLLQVLPGFLEALDLVAKRYTLTFSSQLEANQSVEGATVCLQELLANSRNQDQCTKTTSVGPHRDDLLLQLEGRSLSRFGSRGQQLRFAFALKLAEAEVLSTTQGDPPVMVFDDPVSELDRDGVHRLMAVLSSQNRQLFLAAREQREIPWSLRPLVVCTVRAGVFQVTTEQSNS